jgi:hypothetical protein
VLTTKSDASRTVSTSELSRSTPSTEHSQSRRYSQKTVKALQVGCSTFKPIVPHTNEHAAAHGLTGRRGIAFERRCLQAHSFSCLHNLQTDVAAAKQTQSQPSQWARPFLEWLFHPRLDGTETDAHNLVEVRTKPQGGR